MNELPQPLDPVSCPERAQRLDALRRRVRRLERLSSELHPALPFGVAAMDRHLPEGGLARGAVHEICGGGGDLWHAACAAAFAAGIAARLPGPVLWCSRARDLYGPGLAGCGLGPGRVIHAHADSEATVLACLEEGLRAAGLAAVVGEVTGLAAIPSRRLALAASRSGTMGLVLRRPRRAAPAPVNACATRWQIRPVPQPEGLDFSALWEVALLRCRNGEPASWILEACDAQGRLAVPAHPGHRPAAPAQPRTAAA
jgi:protein ImuA